MQQLDMLVIERALAWSREGRVIWLNTVLATFGSAPREPGSLLVAREDGQHVGSLSGGCVEEDFLERLVAGDFNQAVTRIRYGDPDGPQGARIRLPCGGILAVLVERLLPVPDTWAHLEALQVALAGQRACRRHVDLEHGDPRIDDLAMIEAVRTPAFYIGVMGSQRTSRARAERLRRSGGLDEAQVARLHMPIGLALGSRTPAEIALAVMADVLRVYRGRPRDAL